MYAFYYKYTKTYVFLKCKDAISIFDEVLRNYLKNYFTFYSTSFLDGNWNAIKRHFFL